MNTQISMFGKHMSFASRDRRRGIVVGLYTALAASIAGWLAFPRILGIVATLALLAMLLAMTAIAGSGAEVGDERQVHRRDHVFFIAHRHLSWLLIVVLMTASFRSPIASELAGPVLGALLEQVAWVVLFAFVALYGTLPQAILLWTEPDIEGAR
jgi:hypothetical protein